MDPIYDLARNVVQIKYEDIPLPEIEMDKLSILDNLGGIIAGATAPGCQSVVDYAREIGGRKESTILMHGDKVPAENAALANGVMAHALNFEAAGGGPAHGHASILSTGFAMSERLGGTSGKDFLTAVALAIDTSYRITNSWNPRKYGWDPTIVTATFGTVAMAGKLLKFDVDQLVNAFGVAFSQLASTPQPVCDGAIAARLHPGLAARAGIFSAIMVQKGITGAKNVLQGDYGYYNIYARGEYNTEIIFKDLGKKFHSLDTVFKMYPVTGDSQGIAEGIIALASEHDIKPADVQEITISVAKGNQDFTAVMCRPFKIRECSQIDAQFSHRYAAASSLLHRSSLPEHFTEKYVRDPRIQELITKVKIERVIEPPPNAFPPVKVELVLKNGKHYDKQINSFKGNVDRPLSKEEIIKKFKESVIYSGKSYKILPVEVGEELLELVLHLEKTKDVNRITKLVVAK